MTSQWTTTALGRIGETIAAAYLELQGFTVVARNLRRGRREVDLVATRGDLTCIVEVRLRRRGRYGSAVETLSPAKRARMWSAASELAARCGGILRCDVIAIDWAPEKGLDLVHIVDALHSGR